MGRVTVVIAAVAAMIGTRAWAADIGARVQEIITERCQLCHGAEGEAATAVYPRLAAQNKTYLIKQLRDFRDQRRIGTMNEMAKDLTDAEIDGLAAHFSGQKPRTKAPANADLAAVGRYIFRHGNRFSGIAPCASCHGEAGHGTEVLPRLAGQHPSYVESQVEDFRSGSRTNDQSIMHAIASKLTELEIKAVASYIGGLE